MSISQFIDGFLGASPIEITASLAGFICVLLIIRRNIWCWFFGLIQVSLYTYIFAISKLYSDTALHVFYIGLQFYGWYNWRQHQSTPQQQSLVVQYTNKKDFLFWWLVAIACAGVLGLLMKNYTDASFAFADAFTTCTSLVAQFLLTRRHLLNWIFWIVVDVVAIYIYFQKGLYPTSVLYFTFLIMCVFGQYSWWKQYQRQQKAVSV